jgi:cytochrome b subunit of formate dehydrogenase
MATDNDRLIRHAGIDRLFHWVTAATMTVLLATSLLPVIGIRFAWYQWHWIAGVIRRSSSCIVRGLFWQRVTAIVPRASIFPAARRRTRWRRS